MRSWSKPVAYELLFPSRTAQVLRVLWCLLILWVERGVFYRATSHCDLGATVAPSFRVLLLSDPQIIERHTYEHFSPLMSALASTFSDQYLRKAWLAVTRQGIGASLTRAPGAPDLVVFAGDMTDRGRWHTSFETWSLVQRRWESLFSGLFVMRTTPERPLRARTTRNIPALVLPGNHDIGLPSFKTGLPSVENAKAAQWFREGYAPMADASFVLARNISGHAESGARPSWNVRVPIAVSGKNTTHELVLVNAPDLVSMQPVGSMPFDPDGSFLAQAKARAHETAQFVDGLGDDLHHTTFHPPRILFTHVPLARGLQEHTCDVPWRSAMHGVKRESQRAHVRGGDILQGADSARTYQNLVQEGVSNWLMSAVQPAVIFSGDDHDHCETIHYQKRPLTKFDGHVRGFEPMDVPELTIKSMSMTEGVRRPGYAWLRLEGVEGREPSVDYTPCLLPDQVHLWLGVYLPCFLATVAFLFVRHTCLNIRKPAVPLLPSHVSEARFPAPSERVYRKTGVFVRASGLFGLIKRLGHDLGMVAIFPLICWLALQS